MRNPLILHIWTLTLSIVFAFCWISNDILSLYSLQLTAILLLALIFLRKRVLPNTFSLVESTVSTVSVLLVTSATGGLNSPLFFLNLFLLFELSLLLEPVIPLFLSALLGIFYVFTHQAGQPPYTLFALLSFPTMTPLAYFFGRIYQKVKNQKKQIQSLTHQIDDIKGSAHA